jgi:hypothetical protein
LLASFENSYNSEHYWKGKYFVVDSVLFESSIIVVVQTAAFGMNSLKISSVHLWTIFALFAIKTTDQTCQLNKLSQGINLIFQFTCDDPTLVNPPLPFNSGSDPSEFNYLQLSPNTYTNISTDDLCQFTNIQTLDISLNLLTTISGVFGAIGCFNQIQVILANNNQISMPLLGKPHILYT